MTIRFRCRHCETEIGTVHASTNETIRRLQQFEIGAVDDYVEVKKNGDTIVHCICEQCEDSLRQFPDYHALNKWLQ